MRAFPAHPRVPPELRAVHVLDLELVLGGKLEEPAGDGQELVDQSLVDTVPDEIEETDLVGDSTEVRQEPGRFIGTPIQPGEVKDRKRSQHMFHSLTGSRG